MSGVSTLFTPLEQAGKRLAALTPAQRLAGLSVVLVALAVLFITVKLTGNLNYVLPRRGWMLATMLLVGIAAGVATVLFQTISNNRILTPAVMGFEALFVLIQTSVIFFMGAENSFYSSPLIRFICESLMMTGFAVLLYRWLFSANTDLHRLLLVGLVFGILFTSLSNLMQRMLMPTEFDVLQGRLFARLTLPDPQLIMISALVVSVVCVIAWRMRYAFDVLALGRDAATGLGLNYQKTVTRILLLIAVLVSVSTALIGPLTFLGFMAAILAYQLAGSYQHRFVLPAAAMLGVCFLAGGQLILEHVLSMAGALTVVIEFIGGSLFLLLLLKRGRL